MRQFVATVIAVACCIGVVAQDSGQVGGVDIVFLICLLYTSPSPRD